MKSNASKSILFILAFFIAIYGARLFYIHIEFQSEILSLAYRYTWWLIPVVIITSYYYGIKNILKELCLDHGIKTGLISAAFFASPMLLGSAILGDLVTNLSLLDLLKLTIIAGFMEELIFRGFLFNQLFNRFGWGFIPAATLNALIFAMGHIYQGNSLGETSGVFIVTLLGAAWFAWLFIEWENNLWLIILLHTFMNLSWTIFDVSDNALGDWLPNLFRLVTIAISIIATIRFRKRRGGLIISKKNLWKNSYQ
jgi:membrane protease YdiL (CAAX protease family)